MASRDEDEFLWWLLQLVSRMEEIATSSRAWRFGDDLVEARRRKKTREWRCTERKSGISSRRGTGSTRMVRGRTGPREPGTGKQPEQINRLVNRNRLLDDWVLCRIYNKKRAVEKQPPVKIECSELADEKPAIARPYSEVTVADCVNFEGSDSVPRLLTMDSSCSEQVVSPEPASEVQSEPKRSNTKFEYNYVDANLASQFHSANQMSPLQDIFMYLSKPF
ncbi:NAC domain-containing protein [Vigna angularis]|uniref:NAC domain-containing protein n=1 Tax=Phaseolus angularis TaxID=3914 RepID=A0A8T0JZI7_PHAAN|nr:NAC domain-containing protein [Vigna angularis]